MATVPQALREFRQCVAAMMTAAESVRTAVEAAAGDFVPLPAVATVQQIVAAHFGIPVERILSRDRHADVALARQTAMFLVRECTGMKLERIGIEFGGYDHGTVLHAGRAVENRLSVDRTFGKSFGVLREQVRRALATSSDSQTQS